MGVDAEMVVLTTLELAKSELKRLGWELGDCFGAGRFRIEDGDREQRTIQPVRSYRLETIPLADGWFAYELSLSGRYYGEGYERGDALFYLALGRWLEEKLADAQVYYGGDCSERLDPFDAEVREALFLHFIRAGHRNYTQVSSSLSTKIAVCSFCDAAMMQNRWGPDGITGHYCSGCGYKVTTSAKGEETVTHRPGGMKNERNH